MDQYNTNGKAIEKITKEGHNTPHMFAFFTWNMFSGKILSVQNHWKRNMLITNWCCMCKNGRKSLENFVQCSMARYIWSFVFAFFGVSLVMPKIVI